MTFKTGKLFDASEGLVRDFLGSFHKVRPFYGPNFRDSGDMAETLEKRGNATYPRKDISRILAENNERLGAHAEAIRAARALADENAFAVVTGQQAGLFGGPLYSFYKAATAIKLAERLSSQFGAKCVPLFWVASHDHDFEEISASGWVDTDGGFERLSVHPAHGDTGKPAYRVRPDGNSLEKALKLIASSGNSFPDAAATAALFEECYADRASMADGFARLFARLFGEDGLVVIDPAWKGIPEASRQFFTREIEDPLASPGAATATGEELAKLGYETSIQIPEGRTAFFLEDDAGFRRPVYFDDGKFRLEGVDKELSARKLLEVLEADPGRFSPTVVTRSALQDALLPTIAYAGGPGEIAYHAQLGGVYDFHGVARPVLFPRASVTLVSRETAVFMNEFSLERADLASQPEALFSRLVENISKDRLEEIFDRRFENIRQTLDEVEKDIHKVDGGLKDAVNPTRSRIDYSLEKLRDKALKSLRRQNEPLKARVLAAAGEVFPDGKPQERGAGIAWLLAKAGEEKAKKLAREMEPDFDSHGIIEI